MPPVSDISPVDDSSDDDFQLIDDVNVDSKWDDDFQSQWKGLLPTTKGKALALAKSAAKVLKDEVTAVAPSKEQALASAKTTAGAIIDGAELLKDGLTVVAYVAADAASRAAGSDLAEQGRTAAVQAAKAASAHVKTAIWGPPPPQQEPISEAERAVIFTRDLDGSDEKARRRERITEEWLARAERDPKRERGGPQLWIDGALVEDQGTPIRTAHGVKHVEGRRKTKEEEQQGLRDAIAQGLREDQKTGITHIHPRVNYD